MTANAASVASGLPRDAISDILKGKSKHPRADTVAKLARGLHCTPDYLLEATDDPGEAYAPTPDLPDANDISADMPSVIQVPEYDVRLSAGDGFVVDHETTRRFWPLPRFLVRDQLGIAPGRATVQEILGDSMVPTMVSGDFVLIDLDDTRIGLPGVFAVWDGDALVCKRLERIPASDPAEVRIKSDNPLHGEYRVPEDRVRVIGRVRWIMSRA